ncbi:hypothetical protein SARC_01059 [Sphaeroforma arctica JP610]|uniref:Uncharacterized protein n=1 Tax=Sphaeroforma arctica JP610 TaxID=667725 RepID=A0A0L0GCQ7_9EUKA|nr:hypothetical protein SARC_01059 [Sphaeroforma arctica JP610]KNC86797.1 hypothetical protein SARC_01059 [Sphaeroforma arctica JP610]|eukprot:XP_014160699.1 hypothetical protein SARC_01059 [Sphaeroforma arctica JP610]
MSRIPVPITQVSTAADHTASHSESFGPPVLDSTGPNPVGDGQGDAMAALFEGDNLSDVDMEETVALPIRVETFPANFNRQPSTSYQDGRATEVPENDTCNLAEEMELTKCLPSLLPQHTSTSKPNFPEFQRAPIPAPNSVSHQNPNANSGADYATTTTGASIQNPVQDSNAPASSVPVPLSVPEFTTAPTARAMAGSEDPYDHHVLNDSFEEDFGDGRADATVRMDMTELVGRGILQANGLLANEIAENSSSRSNENGAMASGDQLTANENTEFMDFTEVVGGVLSASGETGSTNANTGTNRNISTKKVHVGPNLGEQDSHIAPRGRNKVDERSVNTQVDMDTDTTNTMRMDMTEAVGGILHALPASGDHADRSELQHKQATGDTEPQSTDTDRMDMTEAVGRILNADEGTIKIPNFFLPVLVSDDVSESSGRRDTSSPPGSKRSSPRANEKTNENAENEREDVVAKRPRRESEQLVSTLNDLSVQPSGSGGVAMVTNQQLGRPDNSDRNGTTSSRPSEVARTDTHPNPANGTEPGQDTDRVVLHTDVANTHTHTPAPAHSGQDLSSHHGDGEPTEVTTHSHTQNLTHTHTHNLTTASTTGMLDVSSISHSPTTARSLNTTRVLAATQAGLLIAQSSVAMATAEPPIEATSTDQDQNTLVAMATRRGGSRLSVSRAPTPVKDLGPPHCESNQCTRLPVSLTDPFHGQFGNSKVCMSVWRYW